MKQPKIKTSDAEDSTERNRATPVVGIGASAGGIGALQAFVPLIPGDSNLAFVVVQHLDPGHTSHLSHLLGRAANIPVIDIANDTPIAPTHIYVIPPDAALPITDDPLLLQPPEQARGFRTPIDGFLLSLAEARG